MNLHRRTRRPTTSTPAAGPRRRSGKRKRYCKVNVAARRGGQQLHERSRRDATWKLTPDAAYLHYTPNETIGGVEFPSVPERRRAAGRRHVARRSCRVPIDVSRFGLIYAGAQKNIGPAGLTVVIVRDDLLGKARPGTPTSSTTRRMADDGSMLNTPPTFGWYIAGSCSSGSRRRVASTRWPRRTAPRPSVLYGYIDASGFYAQSGGPRLPLVDERAVYACRDRSSRRSSATKRRPRASRTSRVTARSAACARASTTRCRSPASMRSSRFMREFARTKG